MHITEMLLIPNRWSRPQIPLNHIKNVVVHYTGNPSSTALANRNYFNNLAVKRDRYVSSHYVIGLEGEIVRCVPENEVAYCSNQANDYSISIETCHPKADGIFTDKTYIALVELCADILKRHNLTSEDLLRHYDVTKKQCPLAWSPTKYLSEKVATSKWVTFKRDVHACMHGEIPTRNTTVDVVSIANGGKSKLPYKIKISSSDGSLNVRKGAGVNNPIAMTLCNGGVFTIVAETKVGNATWGKLKSGAGWINVGSEYVKKV